MAIRKNVVTETVKRRNASYQETESAASDEFIENYEFEEQDNTESGAVSAAYDVYDLDSLPYVSITKIALEPTGGDIMPENNPHIDDVDGANITVDEYGNVEFVSKGIDYLTKTVSSSGLLVNLQLSMKEIIKPNDATYTRADGSVLTVTSAPGTGTWYDNPEFLKYLNIRILESRHPKLTEEIRTGRYGLNPKDYSDTGFRKYATENIISIENEINKDINKYEFFYNADGNKIYDITLETSFYHNKTDPAHLSYFIQTFLDVEQISADYGCGSGNIQAMGLEEKSGTIAAEQVINKKKVSRNSFIFYTSDNKIWIGPVHRRDPGGFYSGIDASSPRSGPLRRVVVSNSKIEDLRDELSLERAEIEFSIIENELLDLKLSSLERSTADVQRMSEYFSEFHNTRDRSGRCRGLFALNYQKILRDKTEFGKMFMNKNLSVVEGLINSCRLSYIKIVRERVEDLDTLNRVGSIVRGRVLFGSNQLEGTVVNSVPKKTVVYSSATAGQKIKTYNRKVTSTGQAVETINKDKSIQADLTTEATIKEIDVYPTTEKDIRHFAFSDHEISLATDGLYRYGVEVTIEDGTKDYLVSLSKRLLLAKKKLLTYYNIASGRINGKKNYNITNKKYSQSFINLQNSQYPALERGRIAGETKAMYLGASMQKDPNSISSHSHSFVIGVNGNGNTSVENDHYHAVAGFKFGQAITENGKEIPGSHTHASLIMGPQSAAPWVESIAEYLEILDIFSAGNHDIDVEKLSLMLYRMLAPESGNPDSILRFIKLIDNLYTKIDSVTGNPVSLSGRASPSSKGASKRLIKFEKMFDEIFDSNITKNVGIDYLSSDSELVDSGLYMVSGTTYITRAKKETTKFYGTSASLVTEINPGKITNDLVANNELSFLSPGTIELGAIGSADLLSASDMFDQPNYAAELETKIMDLNLSPEASSTIGGLGDSSDSAILNTKSSMERIFNAQNAIVGDITEKDALGNSIALLLSTERGLEEVKTYLGKESVMIRGSMNVENLTGGDVGSLPSSAQVELATNTNSTLGLLATSLKASTASAPFRAVSTTAEGSATAVLSGAPSASPLTTGIDMAVFDPESEDSLLDSMQETEFLGLPNQFKSLFVQESTLMSSWIQKLDAVDEESSSTSKAALESVLRINLQLLKSVEVFAGYVVKTDGTKLIKYPRWTSLTYDMYNESTEKVLLCRLKDYDNGQLGATQGELMQLPTYNEYFLLNPSVTQEVKLTKKSQMTFSQYRRDIEKQKFSLQNAVQQTVKKQSFSASMINSNMLVGMAIPERQTKSKDSDNSQGRSRRRTGRTGNY